MTPIKQKEKESFENLKTSFLDFDPAYFIENNLTIDGSEFKIIGNGWKFMVDIYRYIGLQATQKTGKPVVLKKGRQVGATMMAGALDLYFTNSGLFSKPPIRVLHAFPSLSQVKKFSQDKLEGLIRTAKNDVINKGKLDSGTAVDNLTMKQFANGTLWVDSIGEDGDRVRGMTIDVLAVDECLPYDTYIETEFSDTYAFRSKMKIGSIYAKFISGTKLPMVQTFNEETNDFEYKKITNVWRREERDLLKIYCGNKTIKCTENHRFLTTSGWTEAGKLNPGDLLKTEVATKTYIRDANNDQRQMILGSFLGDGHIANIRKSCYRLVVIHGIKQSDYCKWKANIFGVETRYIKENGFAKTEAVTFSTKMFGMADKFPDSKTSCPQWVLDELDARGIAIWYMDDGSTSKAKNAGCLSTCSFDEDSQKRIVGKFKSLGIDCCYRSDFSKSRNKYYFSVYFRKDGFKKLEKLIAPYIHDNLKYKISEPLHSIAKYEWDKAYKKNGLTGIDKIEKLQKKEVVYDIEVEDNHNFIIAPSGNFKNYGGIIAHNCQDCFQQAIGNATKTLTAAKYGAVGNGVQLYFGTPKDNNSYFSSMWDMSDQRYYHLGCKNCGDTFPFYLPEDDGWKDVWISGHTIKCPLCGNLQTKIEAVELGKWVPSRPPEECKFVGFHINQLYIPYFTKENIVGLMPENNPLQTERLFRNEVLGEFYSGAGLPITRAEIYEKCRDQDRQFARAINSRDKNVYLGADWGGKDEGRDGNIGQSYSCVVVLSAQTDGTLLIEHTHKLKKQGSDYRKETIHEMYKRFGVKQGIADYFFGQSEVRDLTAHYGSRFLGAQGSGSLISPLKFREDEMIVGYNKDLMVEEIFEMFRKGKIRFPWKSFEYIEWLIDHCTSMESSIKTVGGQPMKTYSKGTTPNDGLMALMYAVMAWKFDITNRFSIKPGTIGKELGRPRPVLAHMGRRL